MAGGFTIPNEADAFAPRQAGVYNTDIDILASALERTGVIKGYLGACAVTWSSLLIFAIDAGDVYILGARKSVLATTKTLGAAHATLPRFDLIVVDSAGVVQVRAGTAAALPVYPGLTLGDVALAAIYVPATETTSAATRVTDKRMLLAGDSLVGGVGSLTMIGHSFVAGATQADSGTSNVDQESGLAKLQALLGVHEHNVLPLGIAGSYLTGKPGPFNIPFAGWVSAFQFVWPSNSAAINAAADVVVTDPAVATGGVGVIVHGSNDYTIGWDTVAADNAQRAIINANAAKHSYRAIISRLRAGAVFCMQNVQGALTNDGTMTYQGAGWSNLAIISQNSGAGVRVGLESGVTSFTITIPLNFTGGVVAVVVSGQANGVTHLTSGYAASGAVTVAVAANSDFPASGTAVIKNIRTGEEMVVTAGFGSNSWTVTSGNRAANGTGAAAGLTNDVIIVAQDTLRVDWSGTVSSATGSTFISGQGCQNFLVPVVTRFVCTAADAGQTIIGTPVNLVAADTSPLIAVDSWWIESPQPPPVVLTNLHDFEYANNFVTVSSRGVIPAWNTMVDDVAAEFVDGFVRVADVYTPFWKRNGVLASGTGVDAKPMTTGMGTATSTTTTSLDDTDQNWVADEWVGFLVTHVSSGKTATITTNDNNTLTHAGWSGGGSPGAGVYTVSLAGWSFSRILFTSNDASFTPAHGMLMTFGKYLGESVRIQKSLGHAGVTGAHPTWTLTVVRAVAGAAAAHSAGDWMGAADWMHTDQAHINVKGHSVYADLIWNAFKAMPVMAPYQQAQIQGVYSQYHNQWHMGLVDNFYLSPPCSGSGTSLMIEDKLCAVPIWIPRTCIVTEIGVALTVVGSANSRIRFGIYHSDASRARPGRLLQDFGWVDAATGVTDTKGLTGCYQILRPGWYWLACVAQDSSGGTQPTIRFYPANGLPFPTIMNSIAPAGTARVVLGISRAHTADAVLNDWGSTFTYETASNMIPLMYIRVRTTMFGTV